MDCAICKGACCESITLKVQMPTDDLQRFVELRTKPIGQDRNFECRCLALIDGRCGIYPHRPQVCRDFEIGGYNCLTTVHARRNKEQYQLIKSADDPDYDDIPAYLANKGQLPKTH